MKTALTIAGSDCSGGAGIQADLKTMLAHGVYGMSAITALTAQNTCGISGILPVPPDFLVQQIDSIYTDIVPDAVKIGMLPEESLMQVTADRLLQYKAQHVVLDPVMASTSGTKLISSNALRTMTEQLFPLAEVVTPNIPEAEILTGRKISSAQEMQEAAAQIGEQYCCAVLLKGGHSREGADDLLFRDGRLIWFPGRRIRNTNTHGTGCTLSSAIACNLASGYTTEQAIRLAKNYLTESLEAMLDLGKGSGPLDHRKRG